MTAEERSLSSASLIAQTLQLMASNRWLILLALATLTSVALAVDFLLVDRPADLLFSVAAFGFQIWFSVSALGKRSDIGHPGLGSGAAFRVLLVSQLVITVGLFLFVVPGIVLFVRLSIVVPIALSTRGGIHDTLHASWHRIDGRFWQVLQLFVVAYLPILIGLALWFVPASNQDEAIALDAAENLFFGLGLIAGWHAALALFFATEPEPPDDGTGLTTALSGA